MKRSGIRALSLALLGGALLACAAVGVGVTPAKLEGTRWRLASLGAERAPVAETQTEAYLEFGSVPGRVSGSGGCNRLTCSYALRGDEIELGAIAATRMACERGMDTEDALGAALDATAKWAIVDGQLELYAADGRLLATFTARKL